MKVTKQKKIVPPLTQLLTISFLCILQTAPSPSIFLITFSDTLQQPTSSGYSCLLDEVNQGSCTLQSKEQALQCCFSPNSSSFPFLFIQRTTKQKVISYLNWFRTLASGGVVIRQSCEVRSEVTMSKSQLMDGGGCYLVGLGEFCWFPGRNPQWHPFSNAALGGAPLVGLPDRLPLLQSSLLNLSLDIGN